MVTALRVGVTVGGQPPLVPTKPSHTATFNRASHLFATPCGFGLLWSTGMFTSRPPRILNPLRKPRLGTSSASTPRADRVCFP